MQDLRNGLRQLAVEAIEGCELAVGHLPFGFDATKATISPAARAAGEQARAVAAATQQHEEAIETMRALTEVREGEEGYDAYHGHRAARSQVLITRSNALAAAHIRSVELMKAAAPTEAMRHAKFLECVGRFADKAFGEAAPSVSDRAYVQVTESLKPNKRSKWLY